jgi:hypothetical protein
MLLVLPLPKSQKYESIPTLLFVKLIVTGEQPEELVIANPSLDEVVVSGIMLSGSTKEIFSDPAKAERL